MSASLAWNEKTRPGVMDKGWAYSIMKQSSDEYMSSIEEENVFSCEEANGITRKPNGARLIRTSVSWEVHGEFHKALQW